MKPLVLVACLSPCNNMDCNEVKFMVSAVNDEQKYVRAESKTTDYVADAYADVDEEEGVWRSHGHR